MMNNNNIFVRRSINSDVNEIERIVSASSGAATTTSISWSLVIQDSIICISILNENNEFIGFCAFTDGNGNNTSSRSCLWLAHVICARDNMYMICECALQTVFATYGDIKSICSCSNYNKNQYFTKTSNNIYECKRIRFMPDVVLRRAKVEDHDDLLPIFEQQSPILTATYGEFFLAELIEAQSEKNRALVVEVGDKAVGLISLTIDVDVRVLHECFQLELFSNLESNATSTTTTTARPGLIQCSSSLNLACIPGKNNVFGITMYCIEEAFEMQTNEILTAAFNEFPTREYCIITLPHHSPEFQLLSSFTFIPPSPISTLPHVLYVVHRDSLNMKLTVCNGCVDDDETLQTLLAGVDNCNDILACFRHDDTKSYIIKAGNDVVGVVLCEYVMNRDELYNAFNIEEFAPKAIQTSEKSYLYLNYFIVNPLYKESSSYILQEILRLSQTSVLLYRLSSHQPLQPVLQQFIQVRPHIHASYLPHSLHIVTNRILNDHIEHVNSRIVIVGASDTGLGTLETLLLQSHMKFSSITMISRDNLPYASHSRENACLFSDNVIDYTNLEVNALNFDRQIRLIENTVIAIDSVNKYVTLSDETIVPYDYLVLTPGIQSALCQTKPGIHGIVSNKCATTDQLLQMLSNQYEIASNEGMHMKPIVVYGTGIQALSALSTLIRYKIPTDRIVWLNTPSHDNVWCPSERLHNEIIGNIIESGVHVLNDVDIIHISDDINAKTAGQSFISAITLQAGDNNELEPLKQWIDMDTNALQLEYLVCCDDGHIDRQLLNTISNNSIVYDGKIIIDSNFKTNNDFIYAGGTVSKFSRKYGVSQPLLSYNSREIGEELAYALLRMFDDDDDDDDKDVLPALGRLAKLYCGVLPNQAYYYSISKPKLHRTIGRELETSYYDRKCFLKFNAFNVVDSLTFVDKKQANIQRLSQIIGIPSAYLNHICEKYDQMEIYDILSKWSVGLYTQDFALYRNSVRQSIVNNMLPLIQDITNKLHRVDLTNNDASNIIDNLLQHVAGDTLDNMFQDYENNHQHEFHPDKIIQDLEHIQVKNEGI